MMKKMIALVFALGFLTSATLASTKQIDVSIKGMMCSSCAKKMQTKFKAQEGVENVKVDLKKGMVHVTLKDGTDMTDDQIKTLVTDHDYSVAQIHRM